VVTIEVGEQLAPVGVERSVAGSVDDRLRGDGSIASS
jgi:hypothetical protein